MAHGPYFAAYMAYVCSYVKGHGLNLDNIATHGYKCEIKDGIHYMTEQIT